MVKPKTPAASCARCLYIVPAGPEAPENGACRRFPPVPLMRLDGQIATAFPMLRMADYACGEFRAKTS
jgi:hypothetical protein